MSDKNGRIRVLIVDDSVFFREFMRKALGSDPAIEVVGMADDGQEAVSLARSLQPDLITMDLSLPRLGGLEATELIMAYQPTPILVISSYVDNYHADNAVRALAAGALEIVEKPTENGGRDLEAFAQRVSGRVKILAKIRVIRHIKAKLSRTESPRQTQTRTNKIVAVGASTGGPPALERIFSKLPPDFAAPILLVQHITPGFAEGLVQWLNTTTPLQVKLAEEGERPVSGTVHLAPDGLHLMVEGGRLAFDDAEHGAHRPSADVLLGSVARAYGPNAVGVLLTGMGKDGALGLHEIRSSGGFTIAQDEATSVVYGMPQAAADLGAASKVLPIDNIAAALQRLFERG